MIRCKNCLQELKENTESCHNCSTLLYPSPVAYFHTPPLRFLLLYFSIIGTEWYSIYWFYKNWSAIKKVQHTKNIYPFWRAVFSVIFCWRFFYRVFSDAKQYGYKHASVMHKVVVSFMITSFVSLFAVFVLRKTIESNGATNNATAFGLLLSIAVLSLLLKISALLITQRAIKFYNVHAIPGYRTKRKLTRGEIVFTVCGVVIYLVIIILAVIVKAIFFK